MTALRFPTLSLNRPFGNARWTCFCPFAAAFRPAPGGNAHEKSTPGRRREPWGIQTTGLAGGGALRLPRNGVSPPAKAAAADEWLHSLARRRAGDSFSRRRTAHDLFSGHRTACASGTTRRPGGKRFVPVARRSLESANGFRRRQERFAAGMRRFAWERWLNPFGKRSSDFGTGRFSSGEGLLPVAEGVGDSKDEISGGKVGFSGWNSRPATGGWRFSFVAAALPIASDLD